MLFAVTVADWATLGTSAVAILAATGAWWRARHDAHEAARRAGQDAALKTNDMALASTRAALERADRDIAELRERLDQTDAAVERCEAEKRALQVRVLELERSGR